MTFTILPPALRLLMRLQMRARFRKHAARSADVKGALYLCVLLGLFSMALIPALLAMLLNQKSDTAMIRPFSGAGAVSLLHPDPDQLGPRKRNLLSPAEVDFFFRPRSAGADLLVYKLGGMAMSVFLVSFMFSIFLFPLVAHWVLGFGGVFLR